MTQYKTSVCLFLAGLAFMCPVWSAPNPVLPGTADVGVLRHHGQYYLMGMGTDGAMFTSRDLVHWDGPYPAFSMDNQWAAGPAGANTEIHACDLVYHNGTHHLYWSVNYQELRAIGHAQSAAILGPYEETRREQPFDGRIDPHLFVDDDGRCYFYTVKFPLANVIYGQPMDSPVALTGAAKKLLSPLSDTWETLDSRVNEAPCVIKYRGQYYMLYNANHTSLEYGNYGIGCSVADGPLAFRNESKYPFPVLRDNRSRLAGLNGAEAPEPLVRNCGQPNLVRGPNGLEWWLVYFAVYGDDPTRCQAIDRVHFLDRELYVEGPSTSATPGVWFAPAVPTMEDRFEGAALSGGWQTDTDSWRVDQGALLQTEPQGLYRINMTLPIRNHYVFETGLRFAEEAGRQIGVIAWERGPEQALYIGLDREARTWFWVYRHEFVVRTEVFNLPEDFNWGGAHAIRVEKNHTNFHVFLNGIPAPGNPHILIRDARPGRPGLVARDSRAAFEYVMVTAGWDEYDADIAGWGAGMDGTVETGIWGVGDAGLIAEPADGEAHCFKGDLLHDFEWSVQVRPDHRDQEGECGIYALYADRNNFVRIALDAALTRIRVSGKIRGEALPDQEQGIALRENRLASPLEGGMHLRVVRDGERLILFADGLLQLQLGGSWPPAQVGLFADGLSCGFNGITLFERGKCSE